MSWEFFNKKSVVGRKEHRCAECNVAMPPGTAHVYCSGKVEGDFTDYRLCEECDLISTAWFFADLDAGEGWPMGDLRATLRAEGIDDPVSWANAVMKAHHVQSAERELKRRAASATLPELQRLSVERSNRCHPGALNEWSILEWTGAMCGEAGEAANMAKKIRRLELDMQHRAGEGDIADLRAKLGAELADTLAYLLLCAAREGVDLAEAFAAKFNQVSEQYGFPERV